MDAPKKVEIRIGSHVLTFAEAHLLRRVIRGEMRYAENRAEIARQILALMDAEDATQRSPREVDAWDAEIERRAGMKAVP